MLHNKSICIVGNADSLRDKKLGKVIDSHDKVVRINLCYTINLEEDTGFKTTDWIINQSAIWNLDFLTGFFKHRLDELAPHGLRDVAFRTDPKHKDTSKSHHEYLIHNIVNRRFNLHFINVGNFVSEVFPEFSEVKSLNNPDIPAVPTTGFAMICKYIQQSERISIAGFETGKSNTLDHYWPPKDDWTTKIIKANHDIRKEKEMIDSLPITRLDG